MNSRAALHIRMLASISERLKRLLSDYRETAVQTLHFKETYAFYQRLKPWNDAFVKPPMSMLRACEIEQLAKHYEGHTDFALFEHFPAHAQQVIREEISRHLARTALDTFIGGRLRNLAQIGIIRPEWSRYRELVREYYETVIPESRRQEIEATQSILADIPGEIAQLAYRRCEGELFYDVDRIRLMSHHRFETFLKDLVEEAQEARRLSTQEEVPANIMRHLEWLELPLKIGLETLKQRYRELALLYHPDKGGSMQDMQRLNQAYKAVADYIRSRQRPRIG